MTDDELRCCGSILVVASGYTHSPTSSYNLGDRAQLTCTAERLKAAFPESRLIAIANSLNDQVASDDLEISYSAIRYLTSPITIPVIRGRLPTRVGQAARSFILLVNARRIARSKAPRLLSAIGRSAIQEMFESCALFISGAGTFNDLYVSSVGGVWAVYIRCMSSLGKPVAASGQQIGPLRRPSRRAVAKWALRYVGLLGVRDPISLRSALALGI